jgi:hypothetical protein
VGSVTRTAEPVEPEATTGRGQAQHRLTRFCDGLLDVVVVLLASWTVVYHLCLVLRLGVTWAVALEVCALAGCGWLWRRWRRSRSLPNGGGATPAVAGGRPSRLDRPLLVGSALATITAALLIAIDGPWPLAAAAWLTAALGGTAWAVLRLRASDGAALETSPMSASSGTSVALAWAVGLAGLSMFMLNPSVDDIYYLNLSQWVVDHGGTFPLRDTLFSDQVFSMTNWPPVASYDALVGTVARLGGVPAGSVAYEVVPPVATFLSVLALWRLLRAWRVPRVPVAISMALVFMLFANGTGYLNPGEKFLTRIWQGKVLLLCLLVPLLLVYALRYVEQPTRRRAGWLLVAGTAAVGLSTSAMFLVPILAAGAVAPLVVRRRIREAVVGFAAMAAYPFAAGAVTVAMSGHSADNFGGDYRFDPEFFGQGIFVGGVLALVSVTAVLAGAFLVPEGSARVTTGVLTVAFGLTLVPGVSHLTYDAIGLGPTLWRVSWLTTIAARVGVLASALVVLPRRPAVRIAGPLALAAVVVLSGVPIWSHGAGTTLASPPHWQRQPAALAAARLADAAVEPGDIVLAPAELSTAIAVSTTRVKTVRPYGLAYLAGEPGLHYEQRLVLVDFVSRQPGAASFDPASVAAALDTVGVREVCLPSIWTRRLMFLRQRGYSPVASTASYSCLVR